MVDRTHLVLACGKLIPQTSCITHLNNARQSSLVQGTKYHCKSWFRIPPDAFFLSSISFLSFLFIFCFLSFFYIFSTLFVFSTLFLTFVFATITVNSSFLSVHQPIHLGKRNSLLSFIFIFSIQVCMPCFCFSIYRIKPSRLQVSIPIKLYLSSRGLSLIKHSHCLAKVTGKVCYFQH